jgi:hypothetical protein
MDLGTIVGYDVFAANTSWFEKTTFESVALAGAAEMDPRLDEEDYYKGRYGVVKGIRLAEWIDRENGNRNLKEYYTPKN